MRSIWQSCALLMLLMFVLEAPLSLAAADEEGDDFTEEDQDDPEQDEDYDEVLGILDQDKDGKVSLKEVIAKAKEDADGRHAEFEKFRRKVPDYFKEADLDGDNFLDISELPALMTSVGGRSADEL